MSFIKEKEHLEQQTAEQEQKKAQLLKAIRSEEHTHDCLHAEIEDANAPGPTFWSSFVKASFSMVRGVPDAVLCFWCFCGNWCSRGRQGAAFKAETLLFYQSSRDDLDFPDTSQV